MNDQEQRRLLASLDDERPLSPDDTASARASMLAELDRQLGDRMLEAVPEPDAAPNRRWGLIAAAASLVLVIGGLLFLVADRDPDPTMPVDTVVPATPASYLRACVDFRAGTMLDGEGWKAVLDQFVLEGESDQAYLDRLAIQLELLATTPRASSFAAELRDAAAAARGGDDPAELSVELRAIEQLSVRAAAIECLS